jgi:hypothetical protein
MMSLGDFQATPPEYHLPNFSRWRNGLKPEDGAGISFTGISSVAGISSDAMTYQPSHHSITDHRSLQLPDLRAGSCYEVTVFAVVSQI